MKSSSQLYELDTCTVEVCNNSNYKGDEVVKVMTERNEEVELTANQLFGSHTVTAFYAKPLKKEYYIVEKNGKKKCLVQYDYRLFEEVDLTKDCFFESVEDAKEYWKIHSQDVYRGSIFDDSLTEKYCE